VAYGTVTTCANVGGLDPHALMAGTATAYVPAPTIPLTSRFEVRTLLT
jgi:hypothetical protein